MGLYTILTADHFDAFSQTLGEGYDYMTFCFYFTAGGLGAYGVLTVSQLLTSLVGLVSLFSILSKAHLGYL